MQCLASAKIRCLMNEGQSTASQTTDEQAVEKDLVGFSSQEAKLGKL